MADEVRPLQPGATCVGEAGEGEAQPTSRVKDVATT
jgi:hypothetical protein